MTKSALSELLQKKAESYDAETRKNKEIIDEWVEAVRKLFEQLQNWLAASDPSSSPAPIRRTRASHRPSRYHRRNSPLRALPHPCRRRRIVVHRRSLSRPRPAAHSGALRGGLDELLPMKTLQDAWDWYESASTNLVRMLAATATASSLTRGFCS